MFHNILANKTANAKLKQLDRFGWSSHSMGWDKMFECIAAAGHMPHAARCVNIEMP